MQQIMTLFYIVHLLWGRGGLLKRNMTSWRTPTAAEVNECELFGFEMTYKMQILEAAMELQESWLHNTKYSWRRALSKVLGLVEAPSHKKEEPVSP